MYQVECWTATCDTCDQSWKRAGSWNVYERQAVESHPCPRCGAYTLSAPEPVPAPRSRRRLAGRPA